MKTKTSLELKPTLVKLEQLLVSASANWQEIVCFVEANLVDAYNLGLNQGKIEALHAIREELDSGK